MESGEIFTKKSKSKRRTNLLNWTVFVIFCCLILALGGYLVYLQLQDKPNKTLKSLPIVEQNNNSTQTYLDVLQAAEKHTSLLKALSLNIETEVNAVDAPLSVTKTEQGFSSSARLQLAFYNHSELYVKISDLTAELSKQATHNYDVDIELAQQQQRDIVIPPLGSSSLDIYYTTTSQCLLKSFAISWRYTAAIEAASLDFIFQDHEQLKSQLRQATTIAGTAHQLVVNHSDLKAVQEQEDDFCQYEL